MAFATAILADFLAMTEIHEAIEYQSVTSVGASAWKTIAKAIVEIGDDENDVSLGVLHEAGPRPIRVQVAKDATEGVLVANGGRDRIKLKPGTTSEKIYRVTSILFPENPAIWFLYAVP